MTSELTQSSTVCNTEWPPAELEETILGQYTASPDGTQPGYLDVCFACLPGLFPLWKLFGRASNLLIYRFELPQVLLFRIPESPPILGRLHFAHAHCGLRMNDGETFRLFLRQVLIKTAALCKAGFGGKKRNALCCPLAALSGCCFILGWQGSREALHGNSHSVASHCSVFLPRGGTRGKRTRHNRKQSRLRTATQQR